MYIFIYVLVFCNYLAEHNLTFTNSLFIIIIIIILFSHHQ